MKIQVITLENKWLRVLSTSSVYSDDRLKYDEHVTTINGVDFFTPANAKCLIAEVRNRELFDYRSVQDTRDYSEETYLTMQEYRSFMVKAIDDYIEASDEWLMWSIDRGIISTDYKIIIHRRAKLEIVSSPFEAFSGALSLVTSFNLKELERNVFDNEAARDVYLNEQASEIVAKIETGLKA